MIKTKSIIAALILYAGTINAQQTTISNVLDIKSAKSSGSIMSDGQLVGYYIFYQKERQDRSKNAYEIEVYDNNYNSVKSFEITKPSATSLVEMAYNNETFLIQFYTPKIGFEFVAFNKSGTQTGSYKISVEEMGYWGLQMFLAAQQNAQNSISIMPVGKSGFVYASYSKNKKMGYRIICLDNNAKVVWSMESDPNDKMLLMAQITDASESVITATITNKKSLTTMKAKYTTVLINAKTGKVITTINDTDDSSGEKSVLKSNIDEKSKKIMLVGEYFKPGDDPVKDRSQGLYIEEMSIDGKQLSMHQYAWDTDINKLKVIGEGDKDRPFYCYIHDVIKSNNGHIFVIGEQYIKQASALGIANLALGGSSSAVEIAIADMVVIEFDENLKLVDFDLVDKKTTHFVLPSGYGTLPTTIVGQYVNSSGGFDYFFTSRNQEKDQFDVVYIDANRKESKDAKKSDKMIGVISIRNGLKTTSRVPFNTTTDYYRFSPAKPGFISIMEYFKKEKEIKFRIEQIAY